MELSLTLSRILVSILPLAALLGQSSPVAGRRFTVVQDWKAFLGPRDQMSGHFFRASVCQDGSVYLSDGLGHLIRVNADGGKVNDQSGIEAIRSTLALACDQNGHAVAGVSSSSSIVRLEPRSDGSFTITSSVKLTLRMPVFDIVALPGAQGYLVLGAGTARKEPLHTVSLSGEVQSSFGALPLQLNQDLALHAGLNGTLLWDQNSQSVLYMPENPYKLTQFSLAGQSVGEYARADNDFHPMFVDTDSSLPLPSDRVVRAAVVGGGNLLIQVVKHDRTGPMAVSSHSYLEIVDRHLALRLRDGDDPGDNPGQEEHQSGRMAKVKIGVHTGGRKKHIFQANPSLRQARQNPDRDDQ